MSKLAELQLPGNIFSWVGSFLTAHQQVCCLNGEHSILKSFNLGFVQGSGLGLYVIPCFSSRLEYIV